MESPLAPLLPGLVEPQPQQFVNEPVTKEDLAGRFSAKVRINPDQNYDRQVVSQIGLQVLFPFIAQRYPIGARLLLKDIWEMHGQRNFDLYYPPVIAVLETQRLYGQLLQQAQVEQAQAQASQQGQPPPVDPSQHPEVLKAQAQALHGSAMADMQVDDERILQARLRTLQQAKRLQESGRTDG